MKFLVKGKITLNPCFVESLKASNVQHSKIPLMIGWTIGVESLCQIIHMFFNTLMSSSFNFGLVSKIEICVP
jgi:hypothetical protein